MSSTNKTTYYKLPQFVDNDIFNPLVDDNDAYSKIDTALHNIANAEADDASDIVGIKSRLDSAEDDIDALEAQNGSDVLTTVAQTLSGAVNELDGDIGNLQTTVGDNNSGLVKSINDLQSTVSDIPTKRKFILIGDSFGYGVVSRSAPKGTGWMEGFAAHQPAGTAIYLNDAEVEAIEGVAGFCSTLPFIDILTKINNTKFPNNDQATVTDIVVLGGSNDFGVGATAAQIDAAIHAFVTYANAHFPNAKIKIGVLMKRIHDGFVAGIPTSYAQCEKYNVEYISDTFGLCIIPEYYSPDGTHLTASGYSYYQKYINEAIISGRCHYTHEFTTPITIDTTSAFTADDDFSARFYCTEKMVRISFYKTSGNSNNRGWPLAFQSIPFNGATYTDSITLNTPVEIPFRYKHCIAFNIDHEKTISNTKVLSHAQDGFIYNTDKVHFTLAIGESADNTNTGVDRAIVNLNPEQAIWVEY